jgi:hypothetical protein
MEPGRKPPPLQQRLLQPSALCQVENIGGNSVDATPGSASGSDLVEDPQDLTRRITLLPPQGDTELPISPPNTGLTSQALLPEGISSADLSNGAQPCVQIAALEASVDDAAHLDYQPALGEADGVSAEPMSLHPVSPRVAAASMVGEEAAITEAGNDCPLRPRPGVFAVTGLSDLPNEVLLQILRYLDVCDLLCTSRVSRDLLLLCLHAATR